MKEIIIKTQQELDALTAGGFVEYTKVYIQNDKAKDKIIVRQSWGNASVVARGNSFVEARENSSVEAKENSSVVARGNSFVEARENSSVEAWENSSVVARDNSSVVARENSSVVARENSSVEAKENSSVVAWENSSVVARGNSSVVAWGNSSVEAWENSSVVAWENSSVVARENSSVEARGNVGVHVHSVDVTVRLYMFAVCWALVKSKKIAKKAKTATIIRPKTSKGTKGWLESQGMKQEKTAVTVFKRVSFDLKTQEGTTNETFWEIGKTLEHSTWAPENAECGAGKFHACSRPYLCDQFRNNSGDRYVAIKVQVKDLFSWDAAEAQYPYKIAFRKGTVLYESDRLGKKK